ncbi:unnamed protein product, partial [Effrenium voratum]
MAIRVVRPGAVGAALRLGSFWDSAPAVLQLETLCAGLALRTVFLSGDWVPLQL